MEGINIVYSRHNSDKRASVINQSKIIYYDLTLMIKGSLDYSANGEKILLQAGDAIFLPPDTLRSRRAGSEKSDFISFNFHMPESLQLPLHMERVVGNDILLLIAAYDEIERRSYLGSNNKEKKEHLLASILLILEDRVRQREYNPLTLKIMEYIHANISNKITLEDVGKATFFSAVYCDTVFKKEMGRSIIDFLLEERINEAKRLIAEGTMSLSEVSGAVGFEDYNYFSRVFKKRTGYTPTDYKKIIASDQKDILYKSHHTLS